MSAPWPITKGAFKNYGQTEHSLPENGYNKQRKIIKV